ncbi:MAG TPA: tail fiber domain-containing protein [Ignavibacteria bacterium]|nr:tail fiber domain-containing protein [Ignavibacteria bacterium]
MKTLIITFIILAALTINKDIHSQSIINTVGTNGVFSLKNGSTSYFTLSQSTGEVNFTKMLRLEKTSSSTTGVLYKGENRFLHTFGSDNMFVGENSGNFSLNGPLNTAFGNNTLTDLTSGHSNAAFGLQALMRNTTGIENSAFGVASMTQNTTGSFNSAFGTNSLRNNITDTGNCAFGYNSMGGLNFGSYNSAFGYNSLFSNSTGNYNSAFGSGALENNSTGSYNTAVGVNAGSIITTGNNLVCIGYNSQPSSGTVSNQVTLGNSSVTVLRSTQTSIVSLSDGRDKKNIKDLSLGIDFIMTIKPRLYNWDKREWYPDGSADGNKMLEIPTAGFIAQELDDAQRNAGAEWLNLVMKDNPEKWEATPDNLLPVIVNAIQELRDEQTQSEYVNAELISKDSEFKDRFTKLEQFQSLLKSQIEKMQLNQMVKNNE